MRFKTNSGETYNADITIDKCETKSNHSFNLTMGMNDEVGRSKATGILLVKGDHFAMKFEKEYWNK